MLKQTSRRFIGLRTGLGATSGGEARVRLAA